jgi:phospholipid transport system substrate-binding protein
MISVRGGDFKARALSPKLDRLIRIWYSSRGIGLKQIFYISRMAFKMRRKKFLIFVVLVGLMVNLTAGSIGGATSEITSLLKDTIEKVINIVTDEGLKEDKEGRRTALRNTIDQRFNYSQMVRRSLAKNWEPRSEQERQAFIKLFKALLEHSYANKLESYSDEKINYIDEVIKGEYALIKTEVVRSASTIAVDYKLINENGMWKVYDFVIEGVSMIRNYRSQFTKIIRKESYEVLVKKLRSKVNELKNEEKESANL